METYVMSESTKDLVQRLRPSLVECYAENYSESHGPLALDCLEWLILALRGQVSALDIIGIDAMGFVDSPEKRKTSAAMWGIVSALQLLVADLSAVHQLAVTSLPKDPVMQKMVDAARRGVPYSCYEEDSDEEGSAGENDPSPLKN